LQHNGDFVLIFFIFVILACNFKTKAGFTPRSAGWWLVAGLIWRERKILLDGWLAGGWADFA